MSKFYIENEKGERIDLQDDEKYCLAENIKGLGLNINNTYTHVGDYFTNDSTEDTQKVIEFDANFFFTGGVSAFDKEQIVSDFLVRADRLYFVYIPEREEEAEYRCEVELGAYTQGYKDGFLSYPVKLNAITLFYKDNIVTLDVDRTAGEKRYTFNYAATYNDYESRSVEIKPGNQVDVAFDLEIYGYTANPGFDIYENEIKVRSMTFPVVVEEGQKIFYSSRDADLRVQLIDENGVATNLFDKFNADEEIFYKLNKNGSTIKFRTGGANKILFTPYKYLKVV